MAEKDERADSIARIHELIKDIRVAMLTTVAQDGSLHSRPMMTQQAEFDGTLWFLTGQDTAKAGEVAGHRGVNVSYAQPDDHRYVSLSGVATIVRDRQKAEQLWSAVYRAWFPEGLDDPNLVLLKVDVEAAEYWDAASGKMVALAGFLKALATGRRFTDAGDHGKVTLDTSGN
jgi:general stress protein 26